MSVGRVKCLLVAVFSLFSCLIFGQGEPNTQAHPPKSFDANEVIYLHETGLWQAVLSRCEVFLSRTVAEDEAKFYWGTEADEIIDVSVDISAGRKGRAKRGKAKRGKGREKRENGMGISAARVSKRSATANGRAVFPFSPFPPFCCGT